MAALSFAVVAFAFYALTPAKNGRKEAFVSHISNNLIRVLMLSALVLLALSMIFTGPASNSTGEASGIATMLFGSAKKGSWERFVDVLLMLLVVFGALFLKSVYARMSRKTRK